MGALSQGVDGGVGRSDRMWSSWEFLQFELEVFLGLPYCATPGRNRLMVGSLQNEGLTRIADVPPTILGRTRIIRSRFWPPTKSDVHHVALIRGRGKGCCLPGCQTRRTLSTGNETPKASAKFQCAFKMRLMRFEEFLSQYSAKTVSRIFDAK